MTTVASTVPVARRRLGFDPSKPVLVAFAVILFALIVMPLSWLMFYAFSSKSGGVTLHQLPPFGDRSRLSRPSVAHLPPRHSGFPHLLRRGGPHGVARRAHRHAAAPHCTVAGDRVVCHPAFPRRYCLGAVGRAKQRIAQSTLSRA